MGKTAEARLDEQQAQLSAIVARSTVQSELPLIFRSIDPIILCFAVTHSDLDRQRLRCCTIRPGGMVQSKVGGFAVNQEITRRSES